MPAPAKFVRMLVAVDQRIISVGTADAGSEEIADEVVRFLIAGLGAWSKELGDFVAWFPNVGVMWYEKNNETPSGPTS